MLRTVVLGIGCALLLGALVAAYWRQPFSLPLAIIGLVLAGGVAFERWRYKPALKGRPGPGWQPTGERFFDTETGKTMEVYFDPATGERSYVEADSGPRP